MAHKGDRYQQVPTLWHIGWGYPCRVMRKRKGKGQRWINHPHDVLTMATARRWSRLQRQGKAIIRRDTNFETFIQFGIATAPKRAMWAE